MKVLSVAIYRTLILNMQNLYLIVIQVVCMPNAFVFGIPLRVQYTETKKFSNLKS